MSSTKKNRKCCDYCVVDGYEILGDIVSKSPSSEYSRSSTRGSSRSKEETTTSKSKYSNYDHQYDDDDEEKEITYNCYIGGRSQKQVESILKKNISFFFYHKMSESSLMNDLKTHLHLYMAYRNKRGEIYHFRVKNTTTQDEYYKRSCYYLNGPFGKGPQFEDLDNLVKYYRIKTEGARQQMLDVK
uniref:SH2 domain-containing protein n=1 Tax=Parastrongyloides trichosuri TaxID=131310 RepID=A0A0N4Z2H5_PARTI